MDVVVLSRITLCTKTVVRIWPVGRSFLTPGFGSSSTSILLLVALLQPPAPYSVLWRRLSQPLQQTPEQEFREWGERFFHRKKFSWHPRPNRWPMLDHLPSPMSGSSRGRLGFPALAWLEHDPSLGFSTVLFQCNQGSLREKKGEGW